VRRATPGQGDLKDSGTEKIPPFDSALRASLTASPQGNHWACPERGAKRRVEG